MLINLSTLYSVEEQTRKYDVRYDEADLDGAPVTHAQAFTLTVTHHKERDIEVSGEGDVTLQFSCDRCLGPVDVTIPFSFDRKADSATGLDEDGDQVYYFDEEGNLDVNELLKDEIRMRRPMKVLCKEDCKGICHRCGANLNLGKCSCEKEEVPTRMADLISKAFTDAERKK